MCINDFMGKFCLGILSKGRKIITWLPPEIIIFACETLDLDIFNLVWKSKTFIQMICENVFSMSADRNMAMMRSFEDACTRFLCLNE